MPCSEHYLAHVRGHARLRGEVLAVSGVAIAARDAAICSDADSAVCRANADAAPQPEKLSGADGDVTGVCSVRSAGA
jgi:hypothetical protein